MLRQMARTRKQISDDSPCIGTCTLNEDNICIGCNRHIDQIIEAGNEKVQTVQ